MMEVLLIEDDVRTAFAYEELLHIKWPDARVIHVTTAEAGLQLMATQAFDVILTDLQLPGLDGFAILIAASWLAAETPVILVTAHGDHQVEARAARLSGYAVLHKPVEPDLFWEVVSRALTVGRKEMLDPSLLPLGAQPRQQQARRRSA